LTEWFLSLEGTSRGHQVALYLTILAAIFHATIGALQKGKHDPWLSRGAIDICYGVMAAPIAFFIVPWPSAEMWPILIIALLIHSVYKVLQGWTYSRGAYTVVYPVVRGTTPLFTIIGSYFVFGEILTPIQWAGVLFLVSGIISLALFNLNTIVLDRHKLASALVLAVTTGVFVAAYTTYDAYGIRAAINPFTFIFWLFMIDGFFIPTVAFFRWRSMDIKPDLQGLFGRGFFGAIIAFFSFGSIMMATRLDNVGEIAVVRETSVIFAALIGSLFLNERVGSKRLILIVVIAFGAVVTKIGG
jgi:drug/metabolite transporter (DMT)-like permease